VKEISMAELILYAALVAPAAPPEVAPPPRSIDPDDAANRSLRWILRFQVQSGKDYVEQLKLLGATVLVPHPTDDKKALLFPDLAKPDTQRDPSGDDLKGLAEKIKFSDARKEVVESVAQALGLDFKPKAFWAFFPRAVEDELAKKELAYRNRKADEIDQTVFRVVVRDGKAEITVVEQRVKRKP
jgi:hypothetical protein